VSGIEEEKQNAMETDISPIEEMDFDILSAAEVFQKL